jgi:hypothetical protein
MLLGTIGELESGLPPYQPGTHALRITNQCVGCHMQTKAFVSETQPANTGHSFNVEQYALCLNCHESPAGIPAFLTFARGEMTNLIKRVQFDLNYWAAYSTNSTNKVVKSLWGKYGNRAWEYTTPGQLSSGGPGPGATEQAQIPVNIRKARFNLYVVLNDGSFGVHNGYFAVTLLNAAEDWITEEVEQ